MLIKHRLVNLSASLLFITFLICYSFTLLTTSSTHAISAQGFQNAGGNTPPIATNDTYTTTEDIPFSQSAPGVLGNDTDPDGDVPEAALSALPSHGTVQLNNDGSFVYTPALNYYGTDSFSYLAYDSLPLPAIAHWTFDDQTNPTADASGNGHDGSLINSPVFSTDVPVTYTTNTASLQFDGVDDRVDVAGTIPLTNNSFTIAFWAKRSALSGNSDFVVGMGTSSTTNNYLHIGFRPTNIFTCAFWNNDLNTTATYTDLDWHHWACTYDATTNYRAIYRDGILVASDIATEDFQGTGTFTIGSRGTGDQFAGYADEVRVYDLPMPASEIVNIMTMPPGTGGADHAVVTLNVTAVNDAPIAVNDTYTTSQLTPFISPFTAGSLSTMFASNNGQDGNMFNVTAGPNDIYLTGFDINVNTTGSIETDVYYKEGTYAGSEQTPGNWTHLGMFMVDAQGQNNPTFLDISSAGGITIPAGEIYGLYLSVTDTALNFRYTNGTTTYSNSDLTFTSGTGNPYPFGSPIASRTWNGTIYYEINIGVLTNDSDAETPSLTAILDTSPTHGALNLNNNGSFVYTPTTSFAGVDTFTYIASDGVLTNTAIVSITVTAVPCQVESTGDNSTDYASVDASALQTAVTNANAGDLLKVAGTCAGVQQTGSFTQTLYLDKSLTIQGGYTHTNWLATPDPVTYPTILDAQENGRVIYIPGTLTVTLDSLTLMNGNITNPHGGGMYINGETVVTLLNSTLISNTAPSGSAIYNFGTLTVYTTTFHQNMATINGTLENEGDLAIFASTFSNNEALRGGGIYGADIGTISLLNTTIANNSADEGGAIHNRGALTIAFSTLANNTANVGSAIHNWGNLSSLELFHTIMAYNTGSTSQCDDENGTLINSLQNLITDGSCAATFTDDPVLSSLGNYGGLTETMLPQAFSPAIDATIMGLYGCGTVYNEDQRGIVRPIEGFCDIGAVELETNFAPIAASDIYTSLEDLPLVVGPSGVLGNDLDGDADSLTAVLDTNVLTGSLNLSNDGSFVYTPPADWYGTTTFTYHANDGENDSNTTVVTITITSQPDAPIASNDNYTTIEDTPLTISASGVLENDSDADGDSLTAVLETTVTTGTLTLNSDGSFSYTPPANWFGVTNFTYYANDGQEDSNTAVVTLTVLSENDLPVVNAGGDETANEGEVISFSGSYIDPGRLYSVPSSQYSVPSLQNWMGGVSVHWDFGDGATTTGTLTPTHSYADNGTFTVTLTITDTENGVSSDSLLVTVNNVVPVLENLPTQTISVGTAISFTASFTDAGVADTHTAVIDWGDGTVEQGTVNQSAMTIAGSHSYTNPGSYTVTLTITDDDGGSNSQTFTITVTTNGYQLFLPIIVN